MRCESLDNRSNRGILLDIERLLMQLGRITLMADQDFATQLSRLQQDVAAETNQITAAETLLSGLSAAMKASANDPAAISALADTIEAKTAELAAAVAANTPAAPPAPTPTPTPAAAPADGSTTGDQTPA